MSQHLSFTKLESSMRTYTVIFADHCMPKDPHSSWHKIHTQQSCEYVRKQDEEEEEQAEET